MIPPLALIIDFFQFHEFMKILKIVKLHFFRNSIFCKITKIQKMIILFSLNTD